MHERLAYLFLFQRPTTCTQCVPIFNKLMEQHCHNLLTVAKSLFDKLMQRNCQNLLTSLLQAFCEKSISQVNVTELSKLVYKLATSLFRKVLLTR